MEVEASRAEPSTPRLLRLKCDRQTRKEGDGAGAWVMEGLKGQKSTGAVSNPVDFHTLLNHAINRGVEPVWMAKRDNTFRNTNVCCKVRLKRTVKFCFF